MEKKLRLELSLLLMALERAGTLAPREGLSWKSPITLESELIRRVIVSEKRRYMREA